MAAGLTAERPAGLGEPQMAAGLRWPRTAAGLRGPRTAEGLHGPRKEAGLTSPRTAVQDLRQHRPAIRSSTGERLVGLTAEWRPHVMTTVKADPAIHNAKLM